MDTHTIQDGKPVIIPGVLPHIACYYDEADGYTALFDPVRGVHIALTKAQIADPDTVQKAVTMLREL